MYNEKPFQALMLAAILTVVGTVTAEASCKSGDRYEDQGNGTILDCNTKLYWLKKASCALPGSSGPAVEWQHSNLFLSKLKDGVCGLSDGSKSGDWRLPTIDELCSKGAVTGICPKSEASKSLINTNFSSPTVSNTAGTEKWTEGDPFTGVSQAYGYWSSTTSSDTGNITGVWGVGLTSGSVGLDTDPTDLGVIWPVR